MANYISWFRRFDSWIWILGVVSFVRYFSSETYGLAFVILASAIILSHIAGGYRRGDYSIAASNMEGINSAMPKKMLNWLKKGQLQAMINDDTLDCLDQCAEASWLPQVYYTESKMMKVDTSEQYLRAQREASLIADTLMQRALMTVHRTLIYRTGFDDAEYRTLCGIRDNLQLLADESRSLADTIKETDDSVALQSSLDHFHALKNALAEIESDVEEPN